MSISTVRLGYRLRSHRNVQEIYSTVMEGFRLDNNLSLNIYTLFPFFELQEKHNG